MGNMLRWAIVVALFFSLTASVAHAVGGAGSIKGRVALKGAPLAEGKLLLRKPGEKDTLETPIKEGKFSIEMVAAADYEVAIQGKGIPERYSSFEVSPLKITIKAGSNEINFELLDK
jgi:hypothetical protein